MSYYFAKEFAGEKFQAFSTQHWIALGVILLIVMLIYFNRAHLRSERVNKGMRYTLATLLIAQEISLNVWRLLSGTWDIQTSLPLHLCGIAIIGSAIMLARKQYGLFELVYFWGMGGALQALLTPDITDFNFPHYRWIQYFVSHGLIVISVLYMVFVERYQPTLKSIGKTLVFTNIYLAIIAVFNALTGANYLFICQKPEAGSLMDFLGPWPWYIISLEFVALIIFTLCYLPFVTKNILTRSKTNGRPVSF